MCTVFISLPSRLIGKSLITSAKISRVLCIIALTRASRIFLGGPRRTFARGVNQAGFAAAVSGDNLGGETLAITEVYYYAGNPNTFAPTDIVFQQLAVWIGRFRKRACSNLDGSQQDPRVYFSS